LAVWRNSSELIVAEQSTVPKAAACQRRVVLYSYAKSLFVELSDYGDGVSVQTCAVDNNGYLRQLPLQPDQIDTLVEHYVALGFVRVGAWHLVEDRVVRRNFRLRGDDCVCVLDNVTVRAGEFRETCETRELAERLIEEKIAELATDGALLLAGIQTWPGANNPPPLTPVAAPSLTQWPQATSARQAVDQAVARATELHRLFPRGHAVLELLNLPDDDARAAEYGDQLLQRAATSVGRWRNIENDNDNNDDAIEREDSSWQYFRKRYGSFTWIVARMSMPPQLSAPNHTYLNQSCLISIEKEQAYPDIDDMAEALDEPRVSQLHVFDGCWHYALDMNVTDANGEHPIVRFDESYPEFHTLGPNSGFKPFGYWLLERIENFTPELIRWLTLMN